MHEAEKEMARNYYIELMEKENVIPALVSCAFAVIPSVTVLFYLSAAGKLPLFMLMLMLPGIVIGICARIGGGKVFRTRVKLIPAITAVLALSGAWFFLGFSDITLALTIPNAIVAYFIGAQRLTARQILAKHKVERGLVKL